MSSLRDIYVPPEGPLDAKMILVGEGPGANEARSRRPFVGRAGHELDLWIEAAGLRRKELFLTNVTKYMPTEPKDKFFFEGGHPTQMYMEGILELAREIKTIRATGGANVVVAIGNYAMWALIQEAGITKWRGSIVPSKLVPGVKVVPMLHPSFIMRGMQYKRPLCEWDLKRAARESLTPEYTPPHANFVINPDYDQIQEAVEYFTTKADHVTFDSEWFTPNSLAYISFSDQNDYSIVIPFTSHAAFRAYKAILESDVPKWGQNLQFDAVALHRIGIKVRCIKEDTMVAFNACWGDLRQKDLGTISSVYTPWPFYKEDVDFVGNDDEKGQEYCGTDCVVTNQSMETMLKEEFPYLQTEKGYRISMSVMDTFVNASSVGIRCDMDKLYELKKFYLDRAASLEDRLEEMIGYRVNTRSGPQVAKLVYDDLKVRRAKRTTRQEVLMDIAAATSNPQLKAILTTVIRIRQDLNIVSRFVNEKLIDRDGRIRCTWNLSGTRNGRLSTTQPWWPGIALQTMPEEAREMCVPDPGHVFIKWDLEQAEARVVAVQTRDYELLEDMESGLDIHLKLAAQLPFNMAYEELLRICAKKGKDNVRERYLAKKSRHSLNYGGTWVTLKTSINREYLDTSVGVDAREAKKIWQAYLDLHSNLQYWWHQIEKQIRKSGVLENAYGRRRHFLGDITDHLIRDAIAFYPQSTIADTTTISIAEMNEAMPWAQVFAHMHDGGLLQVPEERRDEAIEKTKRITTREIRIGRERLVVPSEVKYGYDWKNTRKAA